MRVTRRFPVLPTPRMLILVELRILPAQVMRKPQALPTRRMPSPAEQSEVMHRMHKSPVSLVPIPEQLKLPVLRILEGGLLPERQAPEGLEHRGLVSSRRARPTGRCSAPASDALLCARSGCS